MAKSAASMPEHRPSSRLTETANTKQNALQPRAISPRLSIEHFKSARSAPHSILSSPNSGFLSPPVSEQWSRSPPPRPDTDDYLGSKAHHEHKKRHRAKHLQRLHSTKEENLVRRPVPEYFAQSSHSECELCEAENGHKKSESVFQALSGNKSTSKAPATRQLATPPSKPTIDPKTLAIATFNEPINAPKSPAAIALRRLSQSSSPVQTSVPNVGRRISNALSATLNFRAASKSSSSGSLSPKDDKVKSPTSSHRTPLHGTGDQDSRRHDTASRTKLDIPATITVRKASDSRQSVDDPVSTRPSVSPNSSNGPSEVVAKNPPSVELVAFYSELRGSDSPQHGHPSNKSRVSAPQPTKNRHDSISQLSQHTNSRRQSAIADVAITFADVHVAQGTFAVEDMSKLIPSGSSGTIQRVSTVQFRSRNSVHEIIWREDETTSSSSISCSSQGSSSPDRSVQFQTIGGLDSDGDASPVPPSHAMSNQSNDIPFLIPDLDTSSTQPKANFLQITWDTSEAAPSIEADKNAITAVKNNPITPNPTRDSTHVSMGEKRFVGAKGKESTLEDITHVNSFPPLPARQSTSEWCRSPLVDLDSPFAGRSVAEAESLSTDLRTKSVGTLKSFTGDDESQSPVRKLSVYSGLPAKTGSSLGISSHRSKPLRKASRVL